MGYSIPKSIKNTRYWGTRISPGLAHGVTLYPRDNFAPTPPSPQGTYRYDFRDLAGYGGMGAAGDVEIVMAARPGTDPAVAAALGVKGYGTESLRKVAWDAWKQFLPKLQKMSNVFWISFQSGIYPIAWWRNSADKKEWGIFIKFKSPGRHPAQQTINDIVDLKVGIVKPGQTLGQLIKESLLGGIIPGVLGIGGTLNDIVKSIGCSLTSSDTAMLAGTVGLAASGTPVPPEAIVGARAAAQRLCATKDPNYAPQNQGSGLPILPIAALGIAAYLILRKK